MHHEENLLSLPWHLLAKKRAGTATSTELAKLADWFARHAPKPAASTHLPDEAASPTWQRRPARTQRTAAEPVGA